MSVLKGTPCFSSSGFWVWGHTFEVLDSFGARFCVQWHLVSSFYMLISNFPGTICFKKISFLSKAFDFPVKSQLVVSSMDGSTVRTCIALAKILSSIPSTHVLTTSSIRSDVLSWPRVPHACEHMRTHMNIHIHPCIYLHTCTHIYTHNHIHTHNKKLKSF